jgi:nickel/cobalt transporter (NicO) family protein
VLVLAFAVLAVAPGAAPAFGHPLGDPPRAWLSADERVVTIDWVAEDDDAAAVGHAVGLLPMEAVWAYIEELPEEQPTAEQIDALSSSSELEEYLLDHVAIRQDGESCSGEAQPARDFIADGARLRFTCPEPVEQVDLRITLLHDQDPAYRTFGVDGGDQLTVHTASRPEHAWDFTSSAGERAGPAVVLIVGLVLALAGAYGSVRLLRPSARAITETD